MHSALAQPNVPVIVQLQLELKDDRARARAPLPPRHLGLRAATEPRGGIKIFPAHPGQGQAALCFLAASLSSAPLTAALPWPATTEPRSHRLPLGQPACPRGPPAPSASTGATSSSRGAPHRPRALFPLSGHRIAIDADSTSSGNPELPVLPYASTVSTRSILSSLSSRLRARTTAAMIGRTRCRRCCCVRAVCALDHLCVSPARSRASAGSIATAR